MDEIPATLSIAAQVDLLGFSNHLMVGLGDIRTAAGKQAIQRLNVLEEAILLFENEKNKYPFLYPSKIYYRRFNDSLFLGIDLKNLIPGIGENKLYGGTSMSIAEMASENSHQIFADRYVSQSIETAKFIGLIARIHRYINKKEYSNGYAGCRTIISSGLRSVFQDRNKGDDFFSANFAVANAYIVEKKGSEGGFIGNSFFLDENVWGAISYSSLCRAIVAYSKFLPDQTVLTTPFQFNGEFEDAKYFRWCLSKPIATSVLCQNYSYWQLNCSTLTNLVLYDFLSDCLQKRPDIARHILPDLGKPTPTLSEINDAKSLYFFLGFRFDLDSDYSECIDVENPSNPITGFSSLHG